MKSSRPLCASHISMPPLLRSLDVVLELLCFLDAGSIVRLSMTCKRLYRELNGSRYIWLRTIRKSSDSLPEAGRIARLREIATRPFRLRGGFQRMNPSAPHHLSPGRPGGVNNFGSTVAHGGIPMAFTRFKLVYGQDWTELRRLPLLFPGGRYMLTTGSFRDFMDAIFFWDLSDVKQGEGILANSIHPIAKVEVREKKDVSGLDLKVQYDPLSEQVVVLAHFCDYPNHQS
ncbi:uncharacterized protein EI90DRAFT_2251772 [Cantharellus anzutake]|uniref:uncharacterized protein n=1 Tax=Cantharellus anzutake TaxID=1750568 RepID=UPI0019077124|nr:uncharacterized protein EI90DRAFT_2251772 [Cantharellus anzutake]KAF8339556.1 hypothetical protein EI90DRAFT_2251772 [Cantharellus anzutake]